MPTITSAGPSSAWEQREIQGEHGPEIDSEALPESDPIDPPKRARKAARSAPADTGEA